MTYTPVVRKNRSEVVGPAIGADYGRIRFEDIDGDGRKEAIVETQAPILDWGESYSCTKIILRYVSSDDGGPRMDAVADEGP
ncbi:hypothetical protein N9230_03475 [Akkermansiaceae bacterium]|nr:hypothetical protein [Akkermansiaceae bacterium]